MAEKVFQAVSRHVPVLTQHLFFSQFLLFNFFFSTDFIKIKLLLNFNIPGSQFSLIFCDAGPPVGTCGIKSSWDILKDLKIKLNWISSNQENQNLEVILF